jgi:type IV secretory pathway VirD2 relaxase
MSNEQILEKSKQDNFCKFLKKRYIAKLQYSINIKAHRLLLEKYLTREGTGRDGNAAELFGTDLEKYKKNMVGRNICIFLCPESLNVDTKILAEQFIKKLEKQTGYRFYWQGACHFNSTHPHAHLLINGVDKQDRLLAISIFFLLDVLFGKSIEVFFESN